MTATTNAPGSPAAGLTRSSAQRGRAVQGSPTGPSSASRAAVPLTARPREATPTTYHPYQPPMSPEPGCVIHAQISEKDSDTGQGHCKRPHLGEASDRGLAGEGCVWSLMVVGVQPAVKGGGAF